MIGGAPAAAVVFAREVDDAHARRTPRIAGARRADRAPPTAPSASGCAPSATTLWTAVRSEKLGELAAEFDAVHSVERAVEVGSVDADRPAAELRADLIDAVERGMQATLDRAGAENGRAAPAV